MLQYVVLECMHLRVWVSWSQDIVLLQAKDLRLGCIDNLSVKIEAKKEKNISNQKIIFRVRIMTKTLHRIAAME